MYNLQLFCLSNNKYKTNLMIYIINILIKKKYQKV